LVKGTSRLKYLSEDQRLIFGMGLSHQAVLFPRSYVADNYYDTSYLNAADYEYIVRALKKENLAYEFRDVNMSIVEKGGVSDVNRLVSLNEYRKIAQDYWPDQKARILLNYWWKILRNIYIVPWVKWLLKFFRIIK